MITALLFSFEFKVSAASTLASLSLGYWWGGRLADRRPEARLLGRIILLAAFATAAIAATKSFVLGFLQSQGSGLHMAAVWAARLLFAPPAVLLGMVAPFAVRLKPADARTGGRTAGRISSGMNGFLKYAIVSFWRALMAACSRCIWLRFVQVPREIGRFYTGGDSRVPNGLVMTRAQKVRL